MGSQGRNDGVKLCACKIVDHECFDLVLRDFKWGVSSCVTEV